MRLANLLGIPRYQAVGLLEMLWHWTARYSPRGDIGRWPDQEIAKGATWDGDAAKLISALHESGWIDSDDTYRFLIHDWPDHCEQSVKKYLARHKLRFATKSGRRPSKVRTPSGLPLPLPEPKPLPLPEPKPEPKPAPAREGAAPDPVPAGNGALAKDQYFAEIWDVFRHVTGQERLVPSSQEGDVIMQWHREQIPLRSVVATLEETDRERARAARSLAYFDPGVREHEAKRRRRA